MNIYLIYKVSFNLFNIVMNKKKNEMRDIGVVYFYYDYLFQGFVYYNIYYFKIIDSYLYKNVFDNFEM